MVESFVNTFKRDYVCCMDLTDVQAVLAQLPAAFEYLNELHPHSSLKMRSLREFKQHHAAKRSAYDHEKSALYGVEAVSGNIGPKSSQTLHG